MTSDNRFSSPHGLLHPAPEFLIVEFDEKPRQRRYIRSPVSKWRKMIVDVLPENVFLNRAVEVSVRGRDNWNIDTEVMDSANLPQELVLQHT